jgi:hypothetical protein
MKLALIVPFLGACLLCINTVYGQHSDIEFGYDSISTPSAFVIEGDLLTADGIQYWESEFLEDSLSPGNFFSDEPGFITNSAENLLINPDDRIWLRVLNAQGNSAYGVGYVNFYNPVSGMLEASSSRRLLAEHNSASLTDLTFNGTGIESGNNPLFLGAGDVDGDIHDHIFFDLLDDSTAPFGAYGVLFQLESDFASNGFGQTDLTSDRFWIIWNHGMDASSFENSALPAFGAVPEPGSLTLLSLSALGLALRRRRK